jgi:hypothetical protein
VGKIFALTPASSPKQTSQQTKRAKSRGNAQNEYIAGMTRRMENAVLIAAMTSA